MSVSNVFALIGDSSVQRHLSALNLQSRGCLKDCQMLSSSDLPSLTRNFAQIRPETTICILSVTTDVLASAKFVGSIAGTVDTLLSSLRESIRDFCTSHSAVNLFVAPPLYRGFPLWYRDGIATISRRFSETLDETPPKNLHLLPCFSGIELLQDGVNLTPVSGLHYLWHLVDQPEAILAMKKQPLSAQFLSVSSSVRQTQDRLSYLESDHSRLAQVVDTRMAESAEFDDWVTNRSEEDWIVITGLPRLSGDLSRRDWQRSVKDQVSEAIGHVLHANRVRLDFEVLLVTNATRGRTTGRTVYNVQLSSPGVSRRIRELFSGFFRRQNPVRMPSFLSGVSIRNKVTFETRVRIAILKQLGEKYKSSNQGSSFIVRGYDSRPVIVILPPQGSSARPRTMTFISAVRTLPSSLTEEALVSIFKVIGNGLRGKLRSVFVVLDDDQHDHYLELIKSQSSASAQSNGASTFSGVVSGTGAGMDVDAGALLSIRDQPPTIISPEAPRTASRRPDEEQTRRSRSRSRSKERSRERSRSRSRSRGKSKRLSSKSSKVAKKSKRRRSPSPVKNSRSKKRSRHHRSPSTSSSESSGSTSSSSSD